MLHFANNNSREEGDRLNKVKLIVNVLVKNHQNFYGHGEIFCIDEFSISFRECLVMK